ncbi:PREDICTED: uncharacterized protein LOC107073460 [Polistes dominula]|uniref:Uncharacterized protein LOC107073460 n=1 Tax=Polistes dominula TaxID=743375 RepID=A0ABM1JAY6_POLDO|nr:PREDICTED: uncharacterized protein LOC107073460 [Polistes dominula]
MQHELARIKKLEGGDNWNLWKFQVTILSKSCNSWDVVNGKAALEALDASAEARREYEKNKAAWCKANAIAQKIIATTISEQGMMHIINCDNSKSMWDKLVAVYKRRSKTRIHALQQQWYTITKRSEDDIATHVSKLEDIAHRLNLMSTSISDKMLMTKILLTYPEGFDHFMSAWESTPEDQRTKENLISRLSIEEMRLNQREKSNKNALMSGLYSKRHCQNNKYGKKNLQNQNKQYKSNCKPGKCHKCGRPGHRARECRSIIQLRQKVR